MLLFKPMNCYICKTIERDLNDVVRTLRKRILARVDASPNSMMNLDLEIQALSTAKEDIEARYLKHQASCCAVNPAEHSSSSYAFAR
jgi:hypothetical protein